MAEAVEAMPSGPTVDRVPESGELVFYNRMLADIILENIDIRSVNRVRSLNRVWEEVCQLINKRRKEMQYLCYAYDFSANPNKENARVKPAVQLLHDHGLLGHKNIMLVEYLIDHFRNKQWSKPRTGFLFHGGVKSVPDLYSYFNKYVPTDCQLLAVTTTNGIVPSVFNGNTKKYSSTEIQGRSQLIAGVSYLLWPDLGFDVSFFDQNSTLAEYEPKSGGSHKKLKCIMIFTNEYMTRVARRAVYKSFEHVNNLFELYNRGIALGGIVVDNIFRFPAEFNNSDPVRRVRGTKFTGVAISGDNVKAASGVFDSETLDTLEQELVEFKRSLNFNADELNNGTRTMGFLFTCSGRGPAMFKETNAEVGIFNKVFPSVLLTGLYGDGEFGENFWPLNQDSNAQKFTEDEETGFWHFYTSVIVLIHVSS